MTVPAAHTGPRDYVHDKLFPAVRDTVRREFGLEVFTHALFGPGPWPPTVWSHDRAAWTVDAKFIVNDYGLRNRMAIITETPGQPTFERRIYAQYAYFMALLEYTNAHATEMQAVVKAADDETVAKVLAGAESGAAAQLARRRVSSRAARSTCSATHPTCPSIGPARACSARSRERRPASRRSCMASRISRCRSERATLRCRAGISFPRDLGDVAAKLRTHNIKVRVLDKPMRAEGEEFVARENAQGAA